MCRLWRLLQELFGEPPPPRPTGSMVGPAGARRAASEHGEHGGDRHEEDPLLDAAGGPGPGATGGRGPGPAGPAGGRASAAEGPAPDAGHGHGRHPHP